jgi:hypothetical protein
MINQSKLKLSNWVPSSSESDEMMMHSWSGSMSGRLLLLQDAAINLVSVGNSRERWRESKRFIVDICGEFLKLAHNELGRRTPLIPTLVGGVAVSSLTSGSVSRGLLIFLR